jgi:Na+-driven multidrug efflux pump
MMKRILTIAIPTAIENMMFNVGTLIIRRFMVSVPNSTVELAANAVATNIFNLILVFGNTLSTSLMPIIGQCIGAEHKDEAKMHTRNFIFIITAINAVTSLVIFLLLDPLISLYGVGKEASQVARNIMLLSCVVVPVMWASAGVLPSAFRSAGDIKFPLVITMLDMWIVRVGLGYYFCEPVLSDSELITPAGVEN